MATVKCVSLTGDSLPNGRRLIPGATAHNVDISHPRVLAKLNAGRLVVCGEDFDVAGSTIPGVLDWVGTDPQRAAFALTAENARRDEARSTLTDKLGDLAGDTTSEEE